MYLIFAADSRNLKHGGNCIKRNTKIIHGFSMESFTDFSTHGYFSYHRLVDI